MKHLAYKFKQCLQSLSHSFGYHIVRLEKLSGLGADSSSAKDIFEWMHDKQFFERYDRAVARIGKQDWLHMQRSYVLMQLLEYIGSPKGAIAECGVFKGLVSYQFCDYLKKYATQDTPLQYLVFDSFEGTSPRTSEDVVNSDHPEHSLPEAMINQRGVCRCALEEVRANLSDYGFITYCKGWIPDCFTQAKDMRFSFVHVDVDLYQPVLDSAEFFYPRLLPGGVLVFDDYGFLAWPGAKRAVDEFAAKNNIRIIRLPTGQALLFK